MIGGGSGHAAQSAMAALCGIVVRPISTLGRIADNPAPYLAPSVALLAAAIFLGPLLSMGDPGYQREFSWQLILNGAMIVLLPKLAIFWIGRRWGGNRSLQRAIAALAYCMVPTLLLTVGYAALDFYSLAATGHAHTYGLSPGFGYEAFVRYAVGWGVLGWAILLYVNAIRILNGFGYARSAAILALSVLPVYAASIALGLFVLSG